MLELMTGAASRKDGLLEASPEVAGEFVKILSTHVADGDLFGLFDKFARLGLLEKLESWIGRGDDIRLTPDEARRVIGDENIQQLQERLASTKPGMTGQPLLEELVRVLPVVVRRFTRSGQIPPQRILEKSIREVAQSFKLKA